MSDPRNQMREFGLDEELDDANEECVNDALKANFQALDLIVRLKEKLVKVEEAAAKKAEDYSKQLYAERKEYHEWVRKVMVALGMSDTMPLEQVIPYASNIGDQITSWMKEAVSEKERADTAISERDAWEAKYMHWHDAVLEAEHATRINVERKAEELEEKIDFGVSVMGELRGLVEELRAENLKLRQDLTKENNEFQDLRVQYEQRENEVIQLRKVSNEFHATHIPIAKYEEQRREIEKLRHVLKLTEALVPTHVPLKKYEEARREIEGLRSLRGRVEQCLQDRYVAHRGDARNVNGPAREVIESIARELAVDLR